MLAASVRLIASAVDRAFDRNATARAKEVTAFLRGESFDRLGVAVLTEYADRLTKCVGTAAVLRRHRGKIAAKAGVAKEAENRATNRAANSGLGQRAYRPFAGPPDPV